MHSRSHVTGGHHYNITYSLLLSNSTTSLILHCLNFCKLPLTLNSKFCYFVVRVRYRRKKLTFAVSSRNELLVIYYTEYLV